jgi:ribonuclease I
LIALVVAEMGGSDSGGGGGGGGGRKKTGRTPSPPKRRGKGSPTRHSHKKDPKHPPAAAASGKAAAGGHHQHKERQSGSSSQLNSILKSLIKGAAITAGAKFTSGLGSSGGKGEDKTPSGAIGEFDLYLFAQTWAPRFCCTNGDKCKSQDKVGVDDLTIHGLWPAYSEGRGKDGRTYPAFCNMGQTRKFSTSDKLAAHEYVKHGSCTSMTFDEYVEEGVRVEEDGASSVMRDFLNSRAGEVVNIDDIFEEAGGNKRVVVQATQYCQLQELTTCWRKAADGTVGEQMDCPAHVLGSGRNSAVLNNCTKISLEASNEAMKCAFISKELLKILKTP